MRPWLVVLALAAGCAKSDAVATVNGAPIPRADLDRELAAAVERSERQGPANNQPLVPRLRAEALGRLIDEELLVQEAAKRGLRVPDADVDAELARVEQGFKTPAEFQTWVAGSGYTREELRRRVARRLTAAVVVDDEVRSRPSGKPFDHALEDRLRMLRAAAVIKRSQPD